jgi:hypothetical protein
MVVELYEGDAQGDVPLSTLARYLATNIITQEMLLESYRKRLADEGTAGEQQLKLIAENRALQGAYDNERHLRKHAEEREREAAKNLHLSLLLGVASVRRLAE